MLSAQWRQSGGCLQQRCLSTKAPPASCIDSASELRTRPRVSNQSSQQLLPLTPTFCLRNIQERSSSLSKAGSSRRHDHLYLTNVFGTHSHGSQLEICSNSLQCGSQLKQKESRHMHRPLQNGQCSAVDHHPNAKTAIEVQELDGLRHIADDYKVWLLDQFGVLHDGQKAYPGAIEAVRQLAERGAQLVIISNSSKRASVTISKLGPLGFDPAWFVGAITSGELTHKYLKERTDPFFASLGHKCVHFTWSARQAVSTHGLGLTVVQDPEDADFILAHGSEAIGVAGPRAGGENDLDPPATPVPLSAMEDVMKRGAKKGIPMIVANPDEVTVDGRDLAIMPGTLGKMYESMGGHVQWMGKPDPVIYQAARDMLGADLRSVVAVGDSLHHDIGGAAAAGIDSIFVAGGIHAADLGIQGLGGRVELPRLKELIKEKGARTPRFCMPFFDW